LGAKEKVVGRQYISRLFVVRDAHPGAVIILFDLDRDNNTAFVLVAQSGLVGSNTNSNFESLETEGDRCVSVSGYSIVQYSSRSL
jgi:hypothetical protein